MSSSNCCLLTSIQISQEAGQLVWYSNLLYNFSQFLVIHTVKDFGIVNKAEVVVFLMLILLFWQGGVEVCHVVTKRKFPVHSEAKHHQNVMLE